MDKLWANKTEVTIETWGSICDVVETIIQDGQEACKHMWTTSDVLLDFLGFHMLEPIKEAPSPKLNLDEVKRSFAAAKEKIQGIAQLNLQEIMTWIETPNSMMVRIKDYVGKWKTVKKRKIVSEILRAEIHLEQAKSQDIEFLMDLYSMWCSALSST